MNIINIDEAIIILQDLISGADEDRGKDTRITDVLGLLCRLDSHLKGKAYD